MCLLAICISSLKKFLFKTPAHFLVGLLLIILLLHSVFFFFLLLLLFWIPVPYQICDLQIFFHIMWIFFSVTWQYPLNHKYINSHIFQYIFFRHWCSSYYPWSHCLNQGHKISFYAFFKWFIFIQNSEVAQSCLTFCNPMDCNLLGSSVHGIFQARIL